MEELEKVHISSSICEETLSWMAKYLKENSIDEFSLKKATLVYDWVFWLGYIEHT